MYHRFSHQATGDPRFVDAGTLADQLDIISLHYTPISPDTHRAQHVEGRAIPGSCPVVLTIDDGYLDFLDVAHPLLRARGIPAMLFMTTGLADGPFWFWWDKIEYLVRNAPPAKHSIEALGRELQLDLTSADGRQRAWSQVADRCRFAPNDDKLAFISELAGHLGIELPEDAPEQYQGVSWDQLRTMVAEGLLVGAHTVSHPILSRVPHAVAEAEIAESRQRLQAELDRPIPWFCYPQGGPADYTDQLCSFLADEGFTGSYLAYQISSHPGDPYRMPRYCVNSDMVEFGWVMCGAEYLVRRLKSVFGLQPDVSPHYWQN